MLPIIAASTVQFRRGGLLVATLSTVLYVGLVLAQYLAASGLRADPWLAAYSQSLPSGSVARYTVALNVFGFFAVALLSGSLANSLRSAGAQLEQASTEIADLQALNQHVIDSLPSGLATTDQAQRILTFNRGAEAITGVPCRAGRRPRDRRRAAAAGAGDGVDSERPAIQGRAAPPRVPLPVGRRPRRARDRADRDAPGDAAAAAPGCCSRSRT